MMIYLAISGGVAMPVINDIEYPWVLNSFAYKNGVEKLSYTPKELTLDSGAFTAWNSGKSVDVDAFRTWALGVKHDNLRVINLDVIPGEAGRSSTEKERDIGMAQSLENADFLRAGGLNVMEVFHQDEPIEFLDLLLSRLPEGGVICLSPRNDVSTKAKLDWEKSLLGHMMKRYSVKNFPKCHGLAVTSKRLCLAFPYFSVDSSTYMNPARYGWVTNHEGKTVDSKEFMGLDVRNSKKQAPAMNMLLGRMIDVNLQNSAMLSTVWRKRGIDWES